eukprot:COSAG02_NODE_16409_length_1086_cov_0.927052_1_plen_213_part_10
MNWGGDKSAEGQIKGLITDDTHNVRPLYCNEYSVKSHHSFMIFSNNAWIVPAHEVTEERRWFVIEASNKYAGPMTPDKKELYEYLWSVPAEFVAKYYYDRDITKFNSKVVPITEGLYNQSQQRSDPFAEWCKLLTDDEGVMRAPTSGTPDEKRLATDYGSVHGADHEQAHTMSDWMSPGDNISLFDGEPRMKDTLFHNVMMHEGAANSNGLHQ